MADLRDVFPSDLHDTITRAEYLRAKGEAAVNPLRTARLCDGCGLTFVPLVDGQRHCTRACRLAAESSESPGGPAGGPPPPVPSPLAALGAPRRSATTDDSSPAVIDKVAKASNKQNAGERRWLCEGCGVAYTPSRKDQRFHSAACRTKSRRSHPMTVAEPGSEPGPSRAAILAPGDEADRLLEWLTALAVLLESAPGGLQLDCRRGDVRVSVRVDR